MVRLKNKKSNPNPETAFCTGHSRTFIIEFTPSRAWYNGSTSASQAEDEGSIPFARTTLRLGEASGGYATRQTSRTGKGVPHEVLTKCG